jgi:hypothetical protein
MAQDVAAFDVAADAFREQLTVVAENRKTIGDLLGHIASDARRLTFTGRMPKS